MKKIRLILIVLSVLMLIGCISMTVLLLFSNYRNVRLFKQAQSDFQRGDEESLTLAEAQLLKLIGNDSDNEAAFVMLGEIARKRKVYPEQVYYCYMAYRLNPLSRENKEKYIESLCFARYFDRLETFLSQDGSLDGKHSKLLLYAAGHNGNFNKYKTLFEADKSFGELAFLLFKDRKQSGSEKLIELEKFGNCEDPFLAQEILAAQTDLYIAEHDIDRAEKCLQQAYELNRYAFAPALGRFYAQYRSLGKALDIFEAHLAVYHDQSVAIQAAEIYCLLNKVDKISGLRTDYQADSGSQAMLCNYYFDALIALARKDMTGLKELAAPLRKNINTPLAAFIFFCADIQDDDLAAVQASYNTLLAHRNYLNLQEQADNILTEYLKKVFAGKNAGNEQLLALATTLYSRKPDAFIAKYILLAQKRSNSMNIVLLKDVLKRFGRDRGVLKLAIEYYLKNELAEAEHLIALYKQMFARRAGDMLRYEIILNLQRKDHEKVSGLFRQNFGPAILQEYWTFASTTMREDDLLFLSQDKFYEPFCKALLLLKKGDKDSACDLLEDADAEKNLDLLFFAARTLAENGRNQAALEKYALFPDKSPYKVAVLLNTAELYGENGSLTKALELSRKAYDLAPELPEAQLCYADKLYKSGNHAAITEVVKLSSSPYRVRMKKLYIAGMEARIKATDAGKSPEKLRQLCKSLLLIDAYNKTALSGLQKVQASTMPEQKKRYRQDL